jgi:tetratricopeptide (TPR) repeat protein
VSADLPAADRLIRLCCGLPLAMAIVAAQAAARPTFTMDAFADHLEDFGRGLDVFAAGDPSADIRAVFSWSYEQLSPDAAAMFRLLGVHCGQTFAAEAAASLAATPRPTVQPWLAELCRAHLLTEVAPGRYALHDLLATYAQELVTAIDPDRERAARRRMFDHYLHSAHRATTMLGENDGPIDADPPVPGALVVEPSDRRQALAWLVAERATLMAAMKSAERNGFEAHAFRFVEAIHMFLRTRSLSHDLLTAERLALDVAKRRRDRHGQALALCGTAAALVDLGRPEEALPLLDDALDLAARVGDPYLTARVHYSQTLRAVHGRDRADAALAHAVTALDIFRAAGNGRWQAKTLNAIAWLQAGRGDHDAALRSARSALEILQPLDDRAAAAAAASNVATAQFHLGEHRQAIAAYRHALDLAREAGRRQLEATLLDRLGDAYATVHDDAAAGQAWNGAHAILVDLGSSAADAVSVKLGRLVTTAR